MKAFIFDLDGVLVQHFVASDVGDAAGEDGLLLGDALEGELHILGLDFLAGVIGDAFAQLEDVGLVVGIGPAFGQVGHQVEVGAIAHQRVEEVEADDVVEHQQLADVGVGGVNVGAGCDGEGDWTGFCRRRAGRGRGRGGLGGRRRGGTLYHEQRQEHEQRQSDDILVT